MPNAMGRNGKINNRNPFIYVNEKSDIPIVLMILLNTELQNSKEVTEGRGIANGNIDQIPVPQTQSCDQSTSRGLVGVRERARRDKQCRFNALMHHITPALLWFSFQELKKNAATGVDNISWSQYEVLLTKGRLEKLHQEIQTGNYRAKPSRRVHIPKTDGKLRPLGIASVEDKVVQQAVATILNCIYEEEFLGFSYGFRQGRSQHDALDALAEAIQGKKINWILDADIRSFFDEIDHKWMIRFLEHRIADKRITRLVRKWLTAGVMDNGKIVRSRKGTPQGSVISPLLANIYLHYALDLWVNQWRKRYAGGDVIVIRYADDSIIGFQYEKEAKVFLEYLKERMAKFKLELHPDKTRLIRFGRFASRQCKERNESKPETFDFLGFTHCCGTTRTGHFKLVRITIKKRMRATLKAIRAELMRRRHEPIPIIGKWIRRVVTGYLNYYSVPGNLRRLGGFIYEIQRAWRHALLRRSQRNRMNWQRLAKVFNMYLPKLKVLHPYPEVRFQARTVGKSRMR